MQNKEALRQKFQELGEVEVPKHHQTTFAKFTPASQQDLKLGFIQLYKNPANIAKSTVEGLYQNFQAGVDAEFTLYPKTAQGEIVSQADLEDQVELLIKPRRFYGSNNLLVCDYFNNRVQQFSLDGRFTGKTTVPLQGPLGIVTAPDGSILVSCKVAKKIYILK